MAVVGLFYFYLLKEEPLWARHFIRGRHSSGPHGDLSHCSSWGNQAWDFMDELVLNLEPSSGKQKNCHCTCIIPIYLILSFDILPKPVSEEKIKAALSIFQLGVITVVWFEFVHTAHQAFTQRHP